jgi:hypothetical protein
VEIKILIATKIEIETEDVITITEVNDYCHSCEGRNPLKSLNEIDSCLRRNDKLNHLLVKNNNLMTPSLKAKIIEVCDKKIAQKGTNIGVSF